MKAAWSLMGLIFAVSTSAEPLLEGRVRLESGEPVVDAQVRLFDMTDLRQGAIVRAMTDGEGYFALPLAALGGRALPERFALGPNYPNPFNPSTIIPYQLAASSAVRLEVFNLLGQRIATLVDGARPAGFHTATWHATDAAGRAVGAGVYIYRMTVGVESQTGRMVLVDGQAGLAVGGTSSVIPGASDVGGSDEEGVQVYGLVVSGSGLVPYVDSAFRVEAGMAPVELVVSEGLYSASKAADDDFLDLFDAFDSEQEEEEATPQTPNAGGIETRLTHSEGGDREPAWSPDGQRIVFYSIRNGWWDLYSMDADGSNKTQLTTHESGEWSPRWSPDGLRISFVSQRDGHDSIHIMESDGTNETRLTENNRHDEYPRWSPDGRRIAYVSVHRENNIQNREIYVMDADGSNKRRLTRHVEDDWLPAWSPDSQSIAFLSKRNLDIEIYVMDADGRNKRRLTQGNPSFDPAWSPDSRHIAYSKFHSFNDDGNWNYEIYVMDADGRNKTRLTRVEGVDGNPTWSPDGARIAFVSERDRHHPRYRDQEIYVMDADGRNQQRLTYGYGSDTNPEWSPDGHSIVFESYRDGDQEIYVVVLEEPDEADTTAAGEITPPVDNDSSSTDGTVKTDAKSRWLSPNATLPPKKWMDDLPDNAVFDIELVFLDNFPQWQKDEMRWAADLWELSFIDELSDQPPVKKARKVSCGDHTVDLSNRYVDDLTIFVSRHYADGAMATAAVLAVRESDQTTSFGCITIEDIDDHPPGMFLALYYDEVFAHEIGHVLGIGTMTDRWIIENNDMYFEFSSDDIRKRKPKRHYLTAPSAMQALSEMGNWPTDAIPLTDYGDTAHWAKFPLGNSILGIPSGYINEPRITRVDLGVLADLGYPVGEPPTRPTPLMRKGVYNTSGDYYRVEGWNAKWPHPRNKLRSSQYRRGKAVASPANWCGVGRDREIE